MQSLKYLFICCFFWGACSDPNTASYIVLDDIQLIDVHSGTIRPEQKVVLKDSMVIFTGENWQAPPAARLERIAGKGRFVMPGKLAGGIKISFTSRLVQRGGFKIGNTSSGAFFFDGRPIRFGKPG